MSKCPVDLWRGVHTDDFPNGPIVDEQPVPGVLYPTFERKRIGTAKDGKPKFRRPDVQIVDGMVQAGGGTSLFDRERVFTNASWRYMRIPKNTDH